MKQQYQHPKQSSIGCDNDINNSNEKQFIYNLLYNNNFDYTTAIERGLQSLNNKNNNIITNTIDTTFTTTNNSNNNNTNIIVQYFNSTLYDSCTCSYLLQYLPETFTTTTCTSLCKRNTVVSIRTNKKNNNNNNSNDDVIVQVAQQQQSNDKYEWILSNPIHALHMISQFVPIDFDDNTNNNSTTNNYNNNAISIDTLWKYAGINRSDDTTSTTTNDDEPPLLYGEEEERSIVLPLYGYATTFHPLVLSSVQMQEQHNDDTKLMMNTTSDEPFALFTNNKKQKKQQQTLQVQVQQQHDEPKSSSRIDAIKKEVSTSNTDTTTGVCDQDQLSSIVSTTIADDDTTSKQNNNNNNSDDTEITTTNVSSMDMDVVVPDKTVSLMSKASTKENDDDDDDSTTNDVIDNDNPTTKKQVILSVQTKSETDPSDDAIKSSTAAAAAAISAKQTIPEQTVSLKSSSSAAKTTTKTKKEEEDLSSTTTINRQEEKETSVIVPIPDLLYRTLSTHAEHIEAVRKSFLSKRYMTIPPSRQQQHLNNTTTTTISGTNNNKTTLSTSNKGGTTFVSTSSTKKSTTATAGMTTTTTTTTTSAKRTLPSGSSQGILPLAKRTKTDHNTATNTATTTTNKVNTNTTATTTTMGTNTSKTKRNTSTTLSTNTASSTTIKKNNTVVKSNTSSHSDNKDKSKTSTTIGTAGSSNKINSPTTTTTSKKTNNASSTITISKSTTPISLRQYLRSWVLQTNNGYTIPSNHYPIQKVPVGVNRIMMPYIQLSNSITNNNVINSSDSTNSKTSLPITTTSSSTLPSTLKVESRTNGINNINKETSYPVMTPVEEELWINHAKHVQDTINIWMEWYRINRTTYWERRRLRNKEQIEIERRRRTTNHAIDSTSTTSKTITDNHVISREERLFQPFGTIQNDILTTINNSSDDNDGDTLNVYIHNNWNGNQFKTDGINDTTKKWMLQSTHANATSTTANSTFNDDTGMVLAALWNDDTNNNDSNSNSDSIVQNNRDDNVGTDCDSYYDEDELMQCLECSFIGIAPDDKGIVNETARSSKTMKNLHYECICQHMLQSKHYFAVSCGRHARIYSFKSGQYILHRLFEQEKYRIDINETIPSMGWDKHPVYRSFDIFQFIHVNGMGTFWNGMKATYPVPVRTEHLEASFLCWVRHHIFHGNVDDLQALHPAATNPIWIDSASRQKLRPLRDRCRITAPIGFYNLGNTCAMSAVLQCLIHCVPLQRFFLHDDGFNFQACDVYRNMELTSPLSGAAFRIQHKGNDNILVVSELDKLFMRYYNSTTGYDVFPNVEKSSKTKNDQDTKATTTCSPAYQGQPLLLNDMLTTVWRCRGMRHLAGYDQRDAHEFLHSFLDNIGKGLQTYNDVVQFALNRNDQNPPDKDYAKNDIIKKIFQGTLRSILICQDCGKKRVQLEPFMSISLPLSKEVAKLAKDIGDNKKKPGTKLTIDRCLRHFTMSELLVDHVLCPSCGIKTPTRKQHVVSRLPKVLCLHLKRFDGVLEKKVDDFVSFPGRGLNMGPYLPHWSETSIVGTNEMLSVNDAVPDILYDLFGTVNHHGNLDSGHYFANVRIRDKWFRCNDSSVSSSSNEEDSVLQSEGAYLLFYIRKENTL